jgi:hypothetical protein
MLFKENGGVSVLVVDREVSSYGVYVAVAGRQPLSPSILTKQTAADGGNNSSG